MFVGPVRSRQIDRAIPARSSVPTADVQLDDTLPAAARASTTPPAVVHESRVTHGNTFVFGARFTDVRRCGEGGMGTVYRAHDRTLGRDVAIKVLKTNDPARKSRLLQEARAQARIEHNNVCRIYEVGETDGEPYIVMQFIDGLPLQQLRDELSLSGRVTLIRDVARAVHAAHLLGIVHGDIKPSNILVRREANGTLTPFLVDFGIARELKEDATGHGATPGTPVYMAPECVAGFASMSSRVDVYALGATLYELCAGRPPYEDDLPKLVLMRIMTEDPLPLQTIVPAVPSELAAIVMKSLLRDPAKRHATALELADELHQFLEPEQPSTREAAPLELPYVSPINSPHFWRTILLSMVFVVVAVSSALFVERRRSAMTTQVERELIQDAVGMELLMRNAYQMPLHDIERERKQVREWLERIRRRASETRDMDRGIAEYALGRGRYALGEYDVAREHLERARTLGYAPPELEHALGKSLLALYDDRSREAMSIVDEASRRARLAELNDEYRRLALEHLRTALPAKLEAPAYAEALLALHEGRFEEAIVLAREAFAAAPLLYEAKRLEGDAHVAVAVDLSARVPENWVEKHTKHIEGASAAYQAATEIARSDPKLLERVCFLWTHAMHSASYRGSQTRGYFDRARTSCDQAVQADSTSVQARLARAEMLALHVFALANNPEPGDDPTPLIDEAVRAGEEVVNAGYSRAIAKETFAKALRARIMVTSEHLAADDQAVERVTRLYEELLREHPQRKAAWSSALAHVYILRARLERWRGVDLTHTVERGLRVLDESVTTPMAAGMMHQKQAMLYMEQAIQLRDWNQSPRAVVDKALRAIELGRRTHPTWIGFLQVEGITLAAQAHYEIESGRDPRATLAVVMQKAEAVAAASGKDPIHRDQLAEATMLEAMYALRENQDPRPAIARAREMLVGVIEAAPWLLSYRVAMARLELLAARDAVKRKTATQAHFDAIRRALGPWSDASRDDPEGQAVLAQAAELEKTWRAKR